MMRFVLMLLLLMPMRLLLSPLLIRRLLLTLFSSRRQQLPNQFRSVVPHTNISLLCRCVGMALTSASKRCAAAV